MDSVPSLGTLSYEAAGLQRTFLGGGLLGRGLGPGLDS